MSESFILPIRVYYEDTDAEGVVYHARYLHFFERARTEMLRHLGFEQNTLRIQYGVIFAVRTINIEYLHPAKIDDLLQVSAKLVQLKRASFTFKQTIKYNDRILCICDCRIACLNAEKLVPTALPDFLFATFLTKNNE